MENSRERVADEAFDIMKAKIDDELERLLTEALPVFLGELPSAARMNDDRVAVFDGFME